MKFRWNPVAITVALATAAVTVIILAGGAAAATPPANAADAFDPQATNVPYVAWAGEQIRFTKCYAAGELTGAPAVAHYNVVNPTIDAPSSVTPTFEGGVAGNGNLLTLGNGGICAEGTFYSPSPGLADILLNVTDANGVTVAPKHDFIGIWMRMNAPTIAELPGGGDNGTGAFNLGSNGGKPVKPGVIGVSVSGTFTWGGTTYTFPGTSDWSNLAHKLATDTNAKNTSPGDAWYRWDIHDNNALDEGHPIVTACTTSGGAASGVPPALDAVDNCNGDGLFSRILGFSYLDLTPSGDVNGSGNGPYDPLFPPTLLANGVLDAYDVPMPAAQINLTMTGDVGSLQAASKQILFSRDGTGATTAHNLYAPYYAQYIPATSRAAVSSGIDGPQNINDVSGFQTFGLYPNWAILNGAGATGVNACLTAAGDTIPVPGTGRGSYLTGTVYTDEHGNAEALFNPNGGFNLTADANNRCSSFLTGPSTFTTHITATAVYPYKKVAPAQTTAPLTKTVTTAALKSLSCIKKGPNEAFCVETIHDIWGNPVEGAPVKFNANSTGNAQLQPDSAVLGGFDTTGQDYIATPGENFVLVRTNDLGEAGVAVTDSLGNDCVNVRAENLATKVNGNPGVSVFADFNPAAGTTCNAGGVIGGGTGQGTTTALPTTTSESAAQTNTGSSNNSVSNSSTSNSSASNSSTSNNSATGNQAAQGAPTAINNTPPSVVSVTGHKVTVSISVARFITVGHTKYLGVKLASTAKTAKVNITLIGKNGKVIGRVAKTIKTNTLVRVMKVGTTVKSVRVSALSV